MLINNKKQYDAEIRQEPIIDISGEKIDIIENHITIKKQLNEASKCDNQKSLITYNSTRVSRDRKNYKSEEYCINTILKCALKNIHDEPIDTVFDCMPKKFHSAPFWYKCVDNIIKNTNSIYAYRYIKELHKNYEHKRYLVTQKYKTEMLDIALEYSISQLPKIYNCNKEYNYIDNDTTSSAIVPIELNEYEEKITQDLVYYISDIHIEHQIPEDVKTFPDLELWLENKIDNMCFSISNTYRSTLIIAGDTAHNIEFLQMFISILRAKWNGKIISILGNHELWNCSIMQNDTVKQKSYGLSKTINMIKKVYNQSRLYLLTNDIYCQYHGCQQIVINENTIVDMNKDELSKFLHECSFIIFGGTGYAGNNNNFNAQNGIYRNTIKDISHEKKLTEQFFKVYKKVVSAASDLPVICLTHMPIKDWCNEEPVPAWTYINGHTHRNLIHKYKNGAIVCANGQVGYKPSEWIPTQLSIIAQYDPFEQYNDGTYKISSEQYGLFNIGRGIDCIGCNWPGDIIMLKRSGYYMFLLKGKKSLCILNGGRRKKLINNSVDHYYEHMPCYAQYMNNALKKYINYQNSISKEIRMFGGSGRIHGCIVDIDYYNHVFVDPYDGTLSFYYAEDICSRDIYKNIADLLKNHASDLYKKYKISAANNNIALLDEKKSLLKSNQERLPDTNDTYKREYGTEMYQSSNLVRSLDYIFFNNVIRNWSDTIFKPNEIAISQSIFLPSNNQKENKQITPKPPKHIKIMQTNIDASDITARKTPYKIECGTVKIDHVNKLYIEYNEYPGTLAEKTVYIDSKGRYIVYEQKKYRLE